MISSTFSDFVDYWFTCSSSSRAVAVFLFLLVAIGTLYAFSRRSPHFWRRSVDKGRPPCLPQRLKDVLDFDREITVPFEVGNVRVSKILVHPIKSCRGTSVQSSRYTLEGLEYDRIWCVVEQESYAIITAREAPKLVLIAPRIEPDPASPYSGRLVVSFPEGSGCETFSVPLAPGPDVIANWPVMDDCMMFNVFQVQGYVCPSLDGGRSPSEILSHYLEQPVHLIMKGPRVRPCLTTQAYPDLKASAVFQDLYPFLIVSEESLQEVVRAVSAYATSDSPAAHIGMLDRERWGHEAVQMERFRPNIVLKGSGLPFAEDMWRRIVIRPSDPGSEDVSEESCTFSLVSKCARCLLPNVDIATGKPDAAVPYKVLLKFRQNKDPANLTKPCFGCNAVAGGEGIVRVGDRIEVKEWASGIGV